MLSEEKKAGILITVAVHLTVIIFLLLTSISVITRERNTEFILIAFDDEPTESSEPVVEREEEELSPEERDAILASIDRMMAERALENPSSTHNIITSRNPDARGTDADKLYDDAAKLAEALKNGQALTPDEGPDDIPSSSGSGKNSKDDKTPPPAYSGASVLSWSLPGRSAHELPVPAYKCMGGGTVTVIIRVGQDGRVKTAQVDDSTSSNDPCLKKWALDYAKRARFSASQTADNPQTGDIIYQFIPQ